MSEEIDESTILSRSSTAIALEDFVEETRASLNALAKGHNDTRDILDDVLSGHHELVDTVRTLVKTSKVLLRLIEQQGVRIHELETNQRYN